MQQAPGIPTDIGQYEAQADTNTQALNEELNSFVTVGYVPILQRGARLATPDIDYGKKWTQPVVDNQVVHLAYRYESPDVPHTQLPYSQALYNSTVAQKQATSLLSKSLRSPGINEGY
jgi:hypothetical protein